MDFQSPPPILEQSTVVIFELLLKTNLNKFLFTCNKEMCYIACIFTYGPEGDIFYLTFHKGLKNM